MGFSHLGLPVRDERRGQEFYSAYFGFDPATAQQYADGTVIIRNADGCDLALHPNCPGRPGGKRVLRRAPEGNAHPMRLSTENSRQTLSAAEECISSWVKR
jgi:catechol 2,3-dioxygenase-like lactoylglutathione lyase family enzyme